MALTHTKGLLSATALIAGCSLLALSTTAAADASPRSYLDIQFAEYTLSDDSSADIDASGFVLELDAVIGGPVSLAVEHADLELDDSDASLKITEWGVTYHREFNSSYRLGVSALLNNFEVGGEHDDGFSVAIDNDFAIGGRLLVGARVKFMDLGDDFERTVDPADSIDTALAIRLAATYMVTDTFGVNLKAEQTAFDDDNNQEATALIAGFRFSFAKGE